MGTAIFTGVTGLTAFQRRLDVIASNISNVNTTGYRGSRVLFQDLFSQTLAGAAAPVGNFGGTNPVQVGLGVRLGSIDVNHTQGSLLTTGVASDLAIQGQGFFVLTNGVSNVFTRDGSFALNANGLLIDPSTGLRVQGYTADANGIINSEGAPGDLLVPVGGSAIVRATTEASLVGNLDSEATAVPPTVVTRTITVFDSLGTQREITLTFTKRAQVNDGTGLRNAWEFEATFEGNPVTNVPLANTGVVLFNGQGQFISAGSVTGAGAYTALAAGTDMVSIPVALFPGDSVPDSPFDFDIDFSRMTELSADSDVTMSNQNGFPRGVLESFTIGSDGSINGVFSNGLTVIIGQVALAAFSNIAGLERAGDNFFRETLASGASQIGIPLTGGRGRVTGGVLEGSNVDLGTEFSNMIVTQRGFQANARTITAADTLLQETVNLVR